MGLTGPLLVGLRFIVSRVYAGRLDARIGFDGNWSVALVFAAADISGAMMTRFLVMRGYDEFYECDQGPHSQHNGTSWPNATYSAFNRTPRGRFR